MTTDLKHRGANLLLLRIANAHDPKHALVTSPLSATEALSLQHALQRDGCDYIYSAYRSLVLGFASLDRDEYAWSTVQFYYSAFYSCRALLAFNRWCIFHLQLSQNKSPQYLIEAKSGEMAKIPKEKTTHKCVLMETSRRKLIPFLGGQTIDGNNPLEWLIDQREYAQYRAVRLEDPEVPARFRQAKKYSCSMLVEQYLADSQYQYAVDKDHAVIALPLRILQAAFNASQGAFLQEMKPELIKFLQRETKIRRKSVTRLAQLLQ